jgi:hypothetical protein
MERELLETFQAAKKAADAVAGEDDSPEADRCLDALRRLRAISVNTDVLVSTQVSGGPNPIVFRLIRLDIHPRPLVTFPADMCSGSNLVFGRHKPMLQRI